ncbi:MAG: hypothetical protein DWQ04_01525 [Chloroflexi bacterium]|nr:MAG: hypothetical protein DWQ04_01525 [Chloroflexota bacterium]
MTFFFNQHVFVNRENELNAFISLLNHPYRRLFLLPGKQGIGKSWAIRRLNQHCKDTKTVTALIDFNNNSGLTTPKEVIRCIRDNIGGDFDKDIRQTENQIKNDFGPNLPSTSPPADITNKEAATFYGHNSSNSLNLTGDKLKIGGDAFTGNKYEISYYPGNGNVQRQGEVNFRRNVACREALRKLLAEQRLVLFFDHFEKTTEDVANWMHDEILKLILEPSEDYSNLWVVIAGQRVPFEKEADHLRHILHLMEVGPFEKEVVHTYWKEKRKLDSAKLSPSLLWDLCRGKPQDLCLIANNYEISLGR